MMGQRKRGRSWMGRAGACLLALGLFLGEALAGTGAAAAQGRDVLVFAAASLKNALDEAAGQYRQQTGRGVVASYGASSALARQIEAGAPADIFIAADLDWMDYLEDRKLIQGGTRKNLLGNDLVLIAPKGSGLGVRIGADFPLSRLLAGGKLAMGEPGSVPAGKYGKAALENLGVWASVEKSVARAENVRAALLMVARGEASLGIVYRTDAVSEPKVEILGVFPKSTHPPILYPAALTASPGNPDASAFLSWLKSPVARPFFEKQGFLVIP